MFITTVSLKSFRNYDNERIAFTPDINVITGNNGSGKTNILEAIYIASHVKSFKNCTDSDIVQWGKSEYFLEVHAQNDRQDYDSMSIEIGCVTDSNQVQKKLKVDGKEIKKLSDFYGILKVVAFFPDDSVIINGSPDIIRRYFDRLISKIDREYIEKLTTFRRILKNRNRILKDIPFKRDIIKQLDIWDSMFSDCACGIIVKRKWYIDQFNKFFTKAYRELSGFGDDITIVYNPSLQVGSSDEIVYELLTKRGIDIQLKTTSVGPHRDIYGVYGKNSVNFKSYASTGQRRLASLAMKLAEVSVINELSNVKPVILLDDVLSELDDERKHNVLNTLTQENHQVIITCTHSDTIPVKGSYARFTIVNGKVYNQ